MPPPSTDRHREFLRCFTANEAAIRAYVRRLVPLRSDADDVMQEVAVVLWEKFDEFREGGDFRAWALGVARFEVLAWLRDKARDRLVLAQDVARPWNRACKNSKGRSASCSWPPMRRVLACRRSRRRVGARWRGSTSGCICTVKECSFPCGVIIRIGWNFRASTYTAACTRT